MHLDWLVYPSHGKYVIGNSKQEFFVTSCSWEINCSQKIFQKVLLKTKTKIDTYIDANYRLSELVFDYLITAWRFLWEEGHSILVLGLLPQWRSHWYVFGWQIENYTRIATSMHINHPSPSLYRSKRVFSFLVRIRSEHCWAFPHSWEENNSKTCCLLGWEAFGSSRNNSSVERIS